MCATCGCSGGPGVVLRADHDGGHTHEPARWAVRPGTGTPKITITATAATTITRTDPARTVTRTAS